MGQRRTKRLRQLRQEQREQMIGDMARLRQSAIGAQMFLSPTSEDYLVLLKLVDAVDQAAKEWTGRGDCFAIAAHSAGVGEAG